MGAMPWFVKEFMTAPTTNTIYYYKLPITFNYRKYIIGCIADNSVALISQCCIADTNTHIVNDRYVLINSNFIACI